MKISKICMTVALFANIIMVGAMSANAVSTSAKPEKKMSGEEWAQKVSACLVAKGFKTPADFRVVGGTRVVAGREIKSGMKVQLATDVMHDAELVRMANECN